MGYTTKTLFFVMCAIAVVFCLYPFESTVTALLPALIFAVCVSSHAAFIRHQSPVRTEFAGATSGFVTAIAYGSLFAIYEFNSKWNLGRPLVAELEWRLRLTTGILVDVVVVFGGLALAAGAMASLFVPLLALLCKKVFLRSGAHGAPGDEPKSR